MARRRRWAAGASAAESPDRSVLPEARVAGQTVSQQAKGPDRATPLLKAVSGIASALALLTALLYYFGWVRSQSQARAFGADVSVFGMTSPELVIRSADVLFMPLLGAALLVVLGIWLHLRLVRYAQTESGRPRALMVISCLRWSWAVALVVAAALLAVNGDVGHQTLPFLFAFGVGGTWYAQALKGRLDSTPSMPVGLFLALAALMAISLFWMTERVATTQAEARVVEIQQDPESWLGPVAIFTQARLSTPGDGLAETALSSKEKDARYRYDGAYLLQRSGGQLFLVTDWSGGKGRLIMLPENQIARLEFGPGR